MRPISRRAAFLSGLLALATTVLIAQQAPPPLCLVAGDPRRPAGRRLEVADLRRQLRQPSLQPADADHAGQRQQAGAEVDVPDRRHRQLRDHVAPARQRAVRDRAAERGLGDRRAHRPPDLALPPRAARGPDGLLRPGQSRLRDAGRQALHDHAGRAPAGAGHADRRHGVGRDARRSTERLRRHHRADHRQGQGDRRRGRRRVRHPRLHRRLRRQHRQARVALLHDPRPGRARQQHVGRRLVEDGRRQRVGDRRLRPGAEHALLRHRQPGPGLPQREPAGRQPVQRLAGGAGRRHGEAEVALPVHAARRARLGRHRGAHPGGPAPSAARRARS